MTVGNLTAPLFLVLGLLILRQRPRHGMGRLYVVVGALLLAQSVANSWLVSGLPAALRLPLGWFTSWGWVVPPLLVATFGLLLLPDGRLPSPRWRWVARASAVSAIGLVVAMPYDDSVTADLRAAMPSWGEPLAEPVFLVAAVLGLAMVPTCLVAPFVRMHRGGPALRRQLGPVAVAGVVAVVVYAAQHLLVRIPGASPDVVMAVAVGVLPVGVATAVVRGGLFDIHRLVSRVVAYTAVVAALATCYLCLVLGLGALARGLTGGSDDLVVALSTLAVAALFQPLRRGVRTAVDRRFDRARYDAERTLEAFGRSLRDEVDRDAVVDGLRHVVAGTVGAASVGLVLVEEAAS